MGILRRNDSKLANDLLGGIVTIDIDVLLFHKVTQIGQPGSCPCPSAIPRSHVSCGEMSAQCGEPGGCRRERSEPRREFCVVGEEAVCSHAHAQVKKESGEEMGEIAPSYVKRDIYMRRQD
jgi:hypothetical protein